MTRAWFGGKVDCCEVERLSFNGVEMGLEKRKEEKKWMGWRYLY
jgi:hypothetical protein